MRGAEHRVPLNGTSWYVWRDALLRTAGFPAAGLDRLAAPECAAVADRHLAGEAGAEAYEEALATALTRSAAALNDIAGDPLLREAIVWQNPQAVTLLDGLRRSGPPKARNSKRRYRELQLTRFWQRYCGKTETIGFFGPGLWTTVDPDVPGALRAIPGPGLVERRRVSLEPWVLTSYGATLAEDPAMKRWLPPVCLPHYALDGDTLHRPGLPPLSLGADEAAALRECDGRRPAVEVAAALVADPALTVGSTDEAYAMLGELELRRLLKWDANLRLGPTTDRQLDERIAAIGDPCLRERAQAGVDRLAAARGAVAAAAGDPDALSRAMAALAEEFTTITGKEPRRRPGRTYAGRGLCYEDTSRDLRVLLGRGFLDRIGPPLGLVLQAARWVSGELAEAYEEALQKLMADVPGIAGRTTLADLWYPAVKLFWGDGDKPADRVVGELGRRWSWLFGPPGDAKRVQFSATELAERAAQVFQADRPGWSVARIHSPDLHVCAESVEAINAGDFLTVLGELHIAYATLCDRWCTWSRSEPGRLLELAVSDFGQRRIVPLLPPLWSRDAGRNVQIEDAPDDLRIGFAKAPGVPADGLVPAVAVTVKVVDGQAVGIVPDGSRYPLVEFFAHFLCTVAVNAFRAVSDAAHTPRVTVDRLVLFRETWRMRVGDLGDLMALTGEAGQYLAGRRLTARLGLPDRCFVKISSETKPIYVDFTSPVYVASLCTMLRAAREAGGADTAVVISEMLPTPDRTWVPDAAGRTYFGEIRLHLTDPEIADTVTR
jgi:hypothetical protein